MSIASGAIWAAAIMAAKARAFDAGFPAANVRHHFVGQDQEKGVYAKELHIPAGYHLVSHAHVYDHLSILAAGRVRLSVDGITRELTGPVALTIKAGAAHTVRALTDAVWFCIHPTKETDSSLVDAAILKE